MSADPKTKIHSCFAHSARYGGVSDMWIARKQRECGITAPVFLGGRDRFWIVEQLDDWDREQQLTNAPRIARSRRAVQRRARLMRRAALRPLMED